MIQGFSLLYGSKIRLRSVIKNSLLVPDCTEIHTTDSHFELYQKKGLKIINLYS